MLKTKSLFGRLRLGLGEDLEEEEAVPVLLLHLGAEHEAAPEDGDGVEVDKEEAHASVHAEDLHAGEAGHNGADGEAEHVGERGDGDGDGRVRVG